MRSTSAATPPIGTSSQNLPLRHDYHSIVYKEQVCYKVANGTSESYFVVVTSTQPFFSADHTKNFLGDIFSHAPISSSLPQLPQFLHGSDYTKSKMLIGKFSTSLKITFLRGNGASENFRLILRNFL